jgi:integral membrane protein (TIGR01906 family)
VRARTAIARVSAAALTVALPLFLALTALLPLISPLFLRLQYARPDVPPSSRFTPEERQTLAEAAAYYLISSQGIDYLSSIVDANGTPLFNDRELTHMVDVKVLLGKAIRLDIVLALVLAASLAILLGRAETRPRTPFYLLIAALVAPALAVSAMIVVPLQFRWFFVEFHHVFFQGESWLFPRSDTLIQLFPEQFWFDALETWLLLILAVSLALAIGTYIWMRRKKRPASP